MPELKDIPVTDLAQRLTQVVQLERACHIEMKAQDPQRLKWAMRWRTAQDAAPAGSTGGDPGAGG